MSYYRYITQFHDTEDTLFEISIYRPGETDTEYTIPRVGRDEPVLLTHRGGGKESYEKTGIQGQELMLMCYVLNDDISKIEDLMESEYKEYVLDYESEGVLLFRGYLKPENIVKCYEDTTWVGIQLTATDALADLKEIDFRDSDDDIVLLRHTLLWTIKTALDRINDESDSLALDFEIQLNTYEKNLMTATQCPYDKVTANAAAFIKIPSTADPIPGEFQSSRDRENADIMSCWDVIEAVLKPFNCLLKQCNGKYHIINYHELDSYVFSFDWATLTQQSRTATDNIVDISDYEYTLHDILVEHQKIHPLKGGVRTTFVNRNIGSELAGDDLSDWGTYWNITPRSQEYVAFPGHLFSTLYFADGNEFEAIAEFTLKSKFSVTKVSDDQYLAISLAYRVDNKEGTSSSYIPAFLRCYIQWPNDQWSNSMYFPLRCTDEAIDSNQWDVMQSSNRYPFRVTGSGTYNIKLQFIIDKTKVKDWTSVTLRLKNPEIKELTQDESDTHQPIEYQTDEIYEQSTVKGYESLEATLLLADANYSDTGGLAVGSSVTTLWNSYGGSEGIPLIDLYSQNILNNRTTYKNFLRCTVVDESHTINFKNIIKIDGLHYLQISHSSNHKFGFVELELIELLVAKQVYEDIVEIQLKSATYVGTPEPVLEREGEYNEVAHGLSIGDVIRFDTDLQMYVKAQADTPEHAQAVGIVSEVIDAYTFKYISDGYIQSDSLLYDSLGLEEGIYYFLSPDDPGQIIKAEDLEDEDIEQCIGFTTSKGFKIEIDAKNLSWRGVTDVFVEPHEIYPIDYLYYTKRGVDYYVTDIPKMNGVFAGGIVTWLGDMDFAVSPAVYYINGHMYFYEGGTVTLNSGVSGESDSRIDIIVVNTSEQAVGVEGVPAPNPQRPSADPAYQIELTHVLISGGSSPGGGVVETSILSEVIYNENVEWLPSNTSSLSVDYDSLTSPYLGSKCANVSNIGNDDEIEFFDDTSGASHSKDDYTNLSLFLKLKAAMTSEHMLFAQFLMNDEAVSNEVQLPINKENITSWQNVSIGLTSFTFSSDDFNQVRFHWAKTGSDVEHTGFYMDYVKLEGGLSLPETLWQDGYVVDGEYSEGTLTLQRNNNLEDIEIPIPIPENTDETVKYDAGDPTAGYLSAKVVAGTNITLEEGTGADENKLKISASGGGSLPIQVTGLTLLSTGWTLSGSLYYYDLANVNITADSIVDVIPDNADISTVEDAVILPHTDSSSGSVRVYSENEPTADIGVTINIFET